MAKKHLTKKRLLELIRKSNITNEEKNYLEALVRLEITPFDDTHVLTELEESRLIKDILEYNLSIKAIDSLTHNYMPNKYRLEIQKGHNFNIDIRTLDRIFNIINILFGSDIILTYYDRNNIDEIISNKNKKLEQLEEYYYQNYYIYFGALDSEEDKQEIARIKKDERDIESSLIGLEILKDYSDDLVEMDRHIKETFRIKENMSELVEEDKVYTTTKVEDLGKIKVYKKAIKR